MGKLNGRQVAPSKNRGPQCRVCQLTATLDGDDRAQFINWCEDATARRIYWTQIAETLKDEGLGHFNGQQIRTHYDQHEADGTL